MDLLNFKSHLQMLWQDQTQWALYNLWNERYSPPVFALFNTWLQGLDCPPLTVQKHVGPLQTTHT